MKWEILHRSTLYRGFFHLERLRLRHLLFAGELGPAIERECVDRGHAVAVLPYDPVRNEVVLIEQFRVGALESPKGPWLMEIIAGLAEPGEEPEAVARREALEEAGCPLGELLHVMDYYSTPGSSSERIGLFIGHADTRELGGIHGLVAEGEDIRVHVAALDEALAMLRHGIVDSAMPIIALQWLALNIADIRLRWGK